VDDDPGVAYAVARQLERLFPKERGAVVEMVNSVTEALDCVQASLERGGPILVLSDFHLGDGLDGLELIEKVFHAAPETRLMLMSAYPRDTFDDRIEFPLVAAFLSKPFTAEALRTAVAPLLPGPPSDQHPDRTRDIGARIGEIDVSLNRAKVMLGVGRISKEGYAGLARQLKEEKGRLEAERMSIAASRGEQTQKNSPNVAAQREDP
jgi:CheY-like chemotaxis protein